MLKARISISLPEPVLRQADSIAGEENTSRSQVIREAIEFYAKARQARELAEGYLEMAGMNLEITEEMLRAISDWPEWA